jgi:sporulation protein YtfJ
MTEHPFNGIMSTVLTNIKEMVDVNTIVGDAITTPDGTTIIPVSKVSFGFASGGADMPNLKSQTDASAGGMLGVGNGAGVTISPIAFLVVSNGVVKLLPVSVQMSSVDRLIDNMPETIDKINGIIKEYSKKKESAEA